MPVSAPLPCSVRTPARSFPISPTVVCSSCRAVATRRPTAASIRDAGASYPRNFRGIEALKLSDGTSTWMYEHAAADRLAGLIWVDGTHAFVERTDSGYENHWYAWNPTGTTLGAEIAGFPAYGKVDQGRIVGLTTAFLDGGSLIRSSPTRSARDRSPRLSPIRSVIPP